MDIGTTGYVIAGVLWLVGWGLCIWAFVDVLGHERDDFLLIGQDRTTWMVILIAFALACGPAAAFVAAYYLFAVRPKLRTAT